MKKWIKVILGLIFLGALAFATYIAILILSPSTDVIENSVEYHTKEELSELYWQNEDLLNRVKDSVLSNKKVLQALIEEQDGDTGIYLKQDEVYFSHEEWQDVETVFKTFHPIMLMMERKGRPLIFYMPFGSIKQDNVVKRTFLYWFPNEEEREYHEEPDVFPDGVFTQLDEGWYIVETKETR
jgi:hypothetical protein